MSILSAITLIFVCAKLAGYFDYSWWVVFAPLAVQMIVGVGLMVGAVLAGMWAAKE